MTQASFLRKDRESYMPALLRKRSISLAGHATSLALEPEFWAVLDEAARADAVSLAALIGRIDDERGERPLASACRVFALSRALNA
jgi:predicted DNA-binding ribbon-helix-helix protein